ncbi:hypothetical protein MTP04_04240 [Lysinibacillus sp. PLM2]|nr:hypothetical protein MTP04_04240 [Lysinibacillus sp. PLM2]
MGYFYPKKQKWVQALQKQPKGYINFIISHQKIILLFCRQTFMLADEFISITRVY